MEENASNFDSTLGGNINLPHEVNILTFVESRLEEIKELSKAIDAPSGNGLVFQRLPRHMRRRVMGHTSKRMPRSVREAHIKQLHKGGYPPQSKRPSRRHRRRPKNLLSEYNRRQKTFVWLETHIWHARRFHMTERWGYKLPLFPNGKNFRACYRASARHCLLHDISYMVCMELSGPLSTLLTGLSRLCNPDCGLTFAAQSLLTGEKEGRLMLYQDNMYPYGAIGHVDFIWQPGDNDKEKRIWIWSHPSYHTEVLTALRLVFALGEGKREEQRREGQGVEAEKLETRFPPLVFVNEEDVKLSLLRDCLVRFRLTGPLSHAILQATLKPIARNKINTTESTAMEIDGAEPSTSQPRQDQDWTAKYYNAEHFEELKIQKETWANMKGITNPAQLPPNCVLCLTVADPRLFLPGKRIKAVPEGEGVSPSIASLPPLVSHSPIWQAEIRDQVTDSKLPDYQLAKAREGVLVPGTRYSASDIKNAAKVPVVLVQRPGNRDPTNKKLGFASGWDVIAPLGWGMPVWQCMVMQGGRVGGLRELQSLGVEALSPFEPHCSPDSAAGQQEQGRRTQEELDDFFRKPPGKRNNYIKHGIPCPFGAPWHLLVQEWSQDTSTQDFYLLRDQKKLRELRDGTCTISRDPRALLMISVRMENGGGLEEWSPICLPTSESDLTNPPVEKNQVDESEQLRKDAREEHQAKLKSLQKDRTKEREKGEKPDTAEAILLSKQHDAHMRTLWLPEPKELRNLPVRELLGFVSDGSFSFSEGKAAGVGFITEPGYIALVQTKQWNPQLNVLVRKKTTMQYRVARLILL